jgi:hypothetical protein
MALTPEEEAELAELSTQVSPELRALAKQPAGAVIDQKPTGGAEDALGGIKAVFGKDWTPYGRGGQPIAQTPDDQARDASALDAEAERVAGMLDPRFSVVPQILALQSATNDPQGDDAAAAKYQAGQKDAIFIYEPPVAVVRKHLLENPALLRAISPDEVPGPGEVEGLMADSSLYQAASDYMYKKADEAATAKGQKVIRYAKAPWLWDDKEIPQNLSPKLKGTDGSKGVAQTLGTKLEGYAPEAANQAQAFVLGVDDMATVGMGRAAMEAGGQTTMLTQPRPGLNESVPQPNTEVNAWTEEGYPLSYAAGQAVGMLSPRSIFNKLWGSIEEGGGMLARAAAKTRLGGALARETHPVLKSAAGAVGDAATGAVAAGAGQTLQEGVDAAGRGELPDFNEAGERIVGTAKTGGYLAAAGSGLRRGSKYGADGIRQSPRFSGTRGPGAVGRTEPNMEYRLGREPRLSGETRALVKESAAGGYLPGDVLTEEIAGPVAKAAQQNTRVAADRAGAARAGYQRSAEGAEQLPVTQLQETALEKVRSHYQPQPGGGLRAVNDRPPPEQKAFNSLIDEVSTTPRDGASKLTPDEAGHFLSPRAQYKILKEDIEKATTERLSKPVDRGAYLANKPARARDGISEEIEADIDDLIGFDKAGVPRTIDKRSAEYKAAEKQVIRERTDTETTLEPFGGSLAEYLKQRGIDNVYVTPRKLDARRTDKLIELLGKDDDLSKAAQLDRRQFSAGGKRGGYHELLEKQGAEATRHAEIEKSVAPGGDAFQPIAGLYESRGGEKPLVDKVRALADQSGVRPQLDRMRNLQEALAVQNRASFRDASGGTHLRPTNVADAAYLRGAFPALKALEGPLGPLRGSTAGRAALMGGGETEAAQSRAESGARGRYEAARDRRLKEIQDAKAREEQERSQRQTETIRRRR